MPLRNRVAPDGTLHASPARGLFTGNRGVIHDPDSRTLAGQRWTTKAWIVCSCEWKGQRRDVWGRNGPNGHAGWTELFFLDEVTALAAGHRPCFYCRRGAATAFAAAFAKGAGLTESRAPQIDHILHGERRLSAKIPSRKLDPAKLASLPDGAMIRAGTAFLAMRGGRALRWDFAGYETPIAIDELPVTETTLVTPPATVTTLAAGYRPQWHHSASDPASA